MQAHIAVAVLFLCSCFGYGSEPDGPLGEGSAYEFRPVVDLQPTPTREIDVLFVIDDSASMREEQEALGLRGIARFIEELRNERGQALSLHIGFTTTSVGVGPYSNVIDSCGDSQVGQLRALSECGLSGTESARYLVDALDGTGSPVRNFDGELSDAVKCMSDMGVWGCGFEQPLLAMRNVLSPENLNSAGFLRPGALLAVVFVTDEDDCSATDPGLFDPDPSTPLGALSSYRCFADGVVCDSAPPDGVGEYRRCRATGQSAYLTSLGEYRSFVTGLKKPGEVIIGLVAGDTGPVRVALDGTSGDRQVEPSCDSDLGQAVPPIRLASFAKSFGLRGARTSICDPRLDGLSQVGTVLARAARRDRCLRGQLLDGDAQTDGIQPNCRARSVQHLASGVVQEVELGDCRETGTRPCYAINRDPFLCDDTSSHLRLDVSDDVDDEVVLECAVP